MYSVRPDLTFYQILSYGTYKLTAWILGRIFNTRNKYAFPNNDQAIDSVLTIMELLMSSQLLKLSY